MQTSGQKHYYIVEFRFPFHISVSEQGLEAIKAATKEAQAKFNDQFGFKPENWNARVFEFETGAIGAQREYFYSPSGLQIKELMSNIGVHQERVEKGE